jgi:FSR family fosmidomycin resistance protein-like MFS transporter
MSATSITAKPVRVDLRSMSRLSLGHGFVDMCQGAVPALLPILIATRGLNLASATALVSIATIGSAIVQPLFGIWSDRISAPLLAPVGVALAGLGVASVGLWHTYVGLALALGLSGLGVALFHPEGARMAHLVGGGSVLGLSYFSVGGNAGFALGPLAVLLVVAIGGLSATPLLAIPALLVAALLVLDVERLKDHIGVEHKAQQKRTETQPAQWGPFTRLVGAAVARTVPFYALLALIPIYAMRRFGADHSVGSVALTVMLLCGAAGTLIGGRSADRFGKRVVLVWAMVPLTMFLLILPHVGIALMFVTLGCVGFTLDAPFATTVVLGQQYLPAQRGLASGITLGLAIGLGGLLATGLGAVADAIGIHTTLEFLPVFSVIALACVMSLPRPRG